MQIRSRWALLRIHLASWQPTVDTTCVVGPLLGTSLDIKNEFSKIKHHIYIDICKIVSMSRKQIHWSNFVDSWIFISWLYTSCFIVLYQHKLFDIIVNWSIVLSINPEYDYEYLQCVRYIYSIYLATRGEVMGPDTRLLLPSPAAQIDSPCIML